MSRDRLELARRELPLLPGRISRVVLDGFLSGTERGIVSSPAISSRPRAFLWRLRGIRGPRAGLTLRQDVDQCLPGTLSAQDVRSSRCRDCGGAGRTFRVRAEGVFTSRTAYLQHPAHPAPFCDVKSAVKTRRQPGNPLDWIRVAAPGVNSTHTVLIGATPVVRSRENYDVVSMRHTGSCGL